MPATCGVGKPIGTKMLGTAMSTVMKWKLGWRIYLGHPLDTSSLKSTLKGVFRFSLSDCCRILSEKDLAVTC